MRRLLAISALGVTMLIATVAVAVGLLGTPSGELEGDPDPLFVVILFTGLWLYWGLGATHLTFRHGRPGPSGVHP